MSQQSLGNFTLTVRVGTFPLIDREANEFAPEGLTLYVDQTLEPGGESFVPSFQFTSEQGPEESVSFGSAILDLKQITSLYEALVAAPKLLEELLARRGSRESELFLSQAFGNVTLEVVWDDLMQEPTYVLMFSPGEENSVGIEIPDVAEFLAALLPPLALSKEKVLD